MVTMMLSNNLNPKINSAKYLYVTLEREGLGALRDMTDESFMTDIDILCKEHEEAMAEKDKKLAEQNEKLAEQDEKLAEQNEKLAEQDEKLAEQNEKLAEQDKKLIRQILRNYEKGKTPEEIADDLVESVEHVKQICEIIESVSDKENVDEIYKRLSN